MRNTPAPAVFLLLLESEFSRLDFARLLKMALIHDLPELYAGDTIPIGTTLQTRNRMKKSGRQTLRSTAEPARMELISLYDEYSRQESEEPGWSKPRTS